MSIKLNKPEKERNQQLMIKESAIVIGTFQAR